MSAQFLTYHEIIRHLVDFLEGDVTREAERKARAAVQDAFLEIQNAHRWSYYYSQGRLATVAPQRTGTITYTESTRTVTLASATWPSWALYGVVNLNQVDYEVDTVTSSTELTLTAGQTPGADLAAGTSYFIHRDTYPLPVDLVSLDQLVNRSNTLRIEYEHPRNWVNRRHVSYGPGTPSLFTVRGAPRYHGQLACSFHPTPDAVYQFDYLYNKRPRPLLVDDVCAGTVSVADTTTLTVTGSGTAWTDRLEGSVLRLSGDNQYVPDGLAGENPYRYERLITDVASTTSLTVDLAPGEALSLVKYRISDPVDIEPGAMRNAYLRCCEWKIGIGRRMKDVQELEASWMRALRLAQEADSRFAGRRAAGTFFHGPQRLARMPMGSDLG